MQIYISMYMESVFVWIVQRLNNLTTITVGLVMIHHLVLNINIQIRVNMNMQIQVQMKMQTQVQMNMQIHA